MQLSLYHYESCWFCQMVRREIQSLGLEVELRDIQRDSQRMEELVEARGRRTVPVLRSVFSDGRVEWLSESRDIIAHLRTLA